MADLGKWDDELENKLPDGARNTIKTYTVLSILAALLVGFLAGAVVF